MQVNCPKCLRKYQILGNVAICAEGTMMYCPTCENHFIAFPDGLTMLSGSPDNSFIKDKNPFIITEIPFQLDIGDSLQEGRFEIKDYLGRGSIGSVYAVFDKKLGLTLALKVITAPNGLEKDIFNRLVQRVKDSEKISFTKYLLKTFLPLAEDYKGLSLTLLPMALSGQGSLRSWININTDIQKRKGEALTFFREICQGVQSIHDSGFTHLNLKPENIFLSNGTIKISDLDLFRNLHERQAIGWPLACPGDDRDQPIYMAPEQIESAHPQDIYNRADIFALGCILFELLEGNPAYTGNLWAINKHKWMVKPRIRHADEYMADIVWKCLEMDQSHRFYAVNQILDSLKPLSETEGPWEQQDDKKRESFEEICNRFVAYRNAASLNEKFFHSIIKRVPEALNVLKEKAGQGHPEAMYMLGVLFYLGDCVDPDKVEALRLWKLSATKEHGPAQYAVAGCYERGDGCRVDIKEASIWFLKAAENNIVEAQKDIGNCYFYGQGVPEDKLKAVNWYHKAAQSGNAAAQCNLGYCYYKGIVFQQNKNEAIKWLNLSADQGNQLAKRLLENL